MYLAKKRFPYSAVGAGFATEAEPLKAWRIAHGFIPVPVDPVALTGKAARRARKEMEAKRAIWEVWAAQEIPITDPEALIDLSWRHFLKEGRGLYSTRGYLNQLTRGNPVPKLVWDELERREEECGEKRSKRRRLAQKAEAINSSVRTVGKRLAERNEKSIVEAFDKSGIRTKHRNTGHKEAHLIPEGARTHQWAGRVGITVRESKYRNKCYSEVNITVYTSWWRKVGPERAHMFGPQTLVLDMGQLPNGRTTVTLAIQKGRQYAINVRSGYLMRDVRGNPVFTET